MVIRAAFRAPTDALDPPVLPTDADAAGFVDDPSLDLDAGPGDRGLVDILRGLDLDALLAGGPVADLLFDDGRLYAPIDGFTARVQREDWPGLELRIDSGEPLVLPGSPDQGPLARAADVAQVLPGLAEDDFILGKDVDLPLVLPGEGEPETTLILEPRLDLARGELSDMLTLDPGAGGFTDVGETAGLSHGLDDWLF